MLLCWIWLGSSCGEESYFKHSIKLNLLDRTCNKNGRNLSINSTLISDEYQFNCCLMEGLVEKNILVQRSGDTIKVLLPEGEGAHFRQYQCTLEVDTYPRYRYLMINNQLYSPFQ